MENGNRGARYSLPPRRRRSSVIRGRCEGHFGGFHPTELLARERRLGNACVPPANGTARPLRSDAGGTPVPSRDMPFPGRMDSRFRGNDEDGGEDACAGGPQAFPGRRAQERSREARLAKTPPRTCLYRAVDRPRAPARGASRVRRSARSARSPGPAARPGAPEAGGWPGIAPDRDQKRLLATRKPVWTSRNPAGFRTRLAGRLARGRLSQEPPRIMRHSQSPSPPVGWAEPSEGASS